MQLSSLYPMVEITIIPERIVNGSMEAMEPTFAIDGDGKIQLVLRFTSDNQQMSIMWSSR